MPLRRFCSDLLQPKRCQLKLLCLKLFEGAEIDCNSVLMVYCFHLPPPLLLKIFKSVAKKLFLTDSHSQIFLGLSASFIVLVFKCWETCAAQDGGSIISRNSSKRIWQGRAYSETSSYDVKWSRHQCDQICNFRKFLVSKFSCKSIPNYLVKFWATLKTKTF